MNKSGKRCSSRKRQNGRSKRVKKFFHISTSFEGYCGQQYNCRLTGPEIARQAVRDC